MHLGRILNLLLAVVVLAIVLALIGFWSGDALSPFKKIFVTEQQTVKQKVTDDDRLYLAKQIWQPSDGKASSAVQTLIGLTALNFRAKQGPNLPTIFERGLAEVPDALIADGADKSPISRSEQVVDGEILLYGKFPYSQDIANQLLDQTYKLPPEHQVARCAIKFVRAEEGMLLPHAIKGGLETLLKGIEKEYGPPLLTLEGFRFYGPKTCAPWYEAK